MPSPQELERFRSSFRTVGGELTALSARGESYDDLDLPEGGGSASSDGSSGPSIPPSADDLFGETSPTAFGESGPIDALGETPAPGGVGSGDESFDFASFLDAIPDDLSQPAQPPVAEEGESIAPGEDATEPGSSLFEAGMVEPPEREGPAETPALGDPTDFGIPDGLLDGFAEEVEAGRSEDAAEAPDEPANAPEELVEVPGEPANAPDEPLADFSFGDLDISADFGAIGSEDVAPPEDLLAPEDAGLVGEAGPAEEAELVEEAESADETDKSETGGPSGIPDGTEAHDGLPDEFVDTADAFSLFAEEASGADSPAEDSGLGTSTSEGAAGPTEDFSIPDFPMDLGSQQAPPVADAFSAPPSPAGEGSPPEESGEPPIDAFDTFSLDNDFLSAGFGVSSEKEAGEAGEEDGFAHLEDFSLEGIDEVFRGARAKETEPILPARKGGRSLPSAEVEEIVLTEQELEKLQDTLGSYPLNLRIACEELIAEHAVPPEDMSALVRLLVRGGGARETAALASRLIGRSIPIPRGFEKKTGEELEAERATFVYAFVHNILPVLRIFAFVAVLAASTVYLGFEFIYRPIRAHGYYTQGIERIDAGEYARANERFDQGFRLVRSKKWFYRYARGFADKRQYILAEEKFDQLLKLYPRDKRGALEYAAMETKELRNYSKADRILREQILDYRIEDREGLLAQGDNNLEWAELESARYEEARKAFARLIEKYGRRDEFLERMLLYFIRTDKLAEVLPLQNFFLSSEKRKIAGSSLAELGGYLLDKKEEVQVGVPDLNVERIENLRKLLERAVQADPAHPESYYHLARYYERYGNSGEERSAIERSLTAFAEANELSARRTGFRIDAHRRYAALLTYAKEFLPAEQQLVEGIRLYEDALRRRILAPAAEYGRLYSDLGDLEYFKAGDLDAALDDYREAALNGWSPPEIRYRMGYVGYAKEDWASAVDLFFDASTELPLNRRLMFALGNALYRRGDLHAAQGYYNRLLDLLEGERARFPVLVPNARPEHAELAERLMRARNNLGVTLEALAERMGDSRYRARALALYSESARAWDTLTRDPETMVRSSQANLAFLNTRGSLYPRVPYEPQIYAEIDKDVEEPSEWEKILAE